MTNQANGNQDKFVVILESTQKTNMSTIQKQPLFIALSAGAKDVSFLNIACLSG